jgi:hypothetical protein
MRYVYFFDKDKMKSSVKENPIKDIDAFWDYIIKAAEQDGGVIVMPGRNTPSIVEYLHWIRFNYAYETCYCEHEKVEFVERMGIEKELVKCKKCGHLLIREMALRQPTPEDFGDDK